MRYQGNSTSAAPPHWLLWQQAALEVEVIRRKVDVVSNLGLITPLVHTFAGWRRIRPILPVQRCRWHIASSQCLGVAGVLQPHEDPALQLLRREGVGMVVVDGILGHLQVHVEGETLPTDISKFPGLHFPAVYPFACLVAPKFHQRNRVVLPVPLGVGSDNVQEASRGSTLGEAGRAS